MSSRTKWKWPEEKGHTEACLTPARETWGHYLFGGCGCVGTFWSHARVCHAWCHLRVGQKLAMQVFSALLPLSKGSEYSMIRKGPAWEIHLFIWLRSMSGFMFQNAFPLWKFILWLTDSNCFLLRRKWNRFYSWKVPVAGIWNLKIEVAISFTSKRFKNRSLNELKLYCRQTLKKNFL
jgi:hypothetical protein